MKVKYLLLTPLFLFSNSYAQDVKKINAPAKHQYLELSKTALKDKIKGGWAGQTIGVTFGGPVEFVFCGTMMQDYQPILWYDGYIREMMTTTPGLFDDLYMDLTFVDVFEKKGLDAPVEDFANAYANADYELWHANQAGRYNILNGIKVPQSGYWLNNPHADCIDYQIESDFAGLMSPGMPNTASAISDKIGHIMNYGDGWYGGVFVGAMYTQAFTSNNIQYIVKQGLKVIPKESKFYKTINDVITWHSQNPKDWKATWTKIQNKWSEDIGCPEGVFKPFNIDAKINAAYIVLGLLYGEGDFTKTMEIATRAGQDADCNPSSAGGILGTMLGYDKIPDYWKMGLKEAESIPFKYTTMSLNDVYETGYNHALKIVERNGGAINGNNVTIKLQQPQTVKFEESFVSHYPIEKRAINKILKDEIIFEFDGIGFVVNSETAKRFSNAEYIAKTELYIDGQLVQKVLLPASFATRMEEPFWKYQLPKQKHTVRMKILNPDEKYPIFIDDVIIYSNTPAVKTNQ